MYHWENRKKMSDVRGMGLWGHVGWCIAVIFAVIGIIGDAANVAVGLEPMSWLLLAIFAILASMPYFLALALAWYLRTTEAKNKAKE